jgi:hypothetical protein
MAVAAVVVLAWTWGTWPDAIVDFGRELYLAWQVAEGRTLYVDLSHFSGPLSVELNALLFRVFGASIRTLVVANIVLAAACATLLHALLVPLAGRLAATVGGLVFVLLFGCAQYVRIGNYNWVCPYSHELTHGAILALAALWCLARRMQTGRDAWLVAVGVAVGLLALTKAETLFAGGLAVGVGLVLALLAEGTSPMRWLRALALVVAGAAVPLALTVLLFAGRMPFDTLLEWPLGHWLAATRSDLRRGRFYRMGMGIDQGASNVGTMVVVFGAEALAVAAAVVAAILLRPVGARAIVAGALGVATAAALWRWVPIDTWAVASRALPIWTVILAGAALADFVRRRDDPAARMRAALRTALAVLAAALLAKMLLNAHVFHYGFVLAMPATIVVVAAMVAWLPAFVERLGGYGGAVRAVGLGGVVAVLAAHLTFMQTLVALKTGHMGSGADAFRIDDRGAMAAALLRKIETFVRPDQTLVVLPQGAMLNYLARRTNPTPYYLFDRTSRVLWGEAAMTDRIRAAAPDWIAYVERGPNPDPYGSRDYEALHQWIVTHYTPAWQIGTPYSGTPGPGVMLLRRTAEPDPAHPTRSRE